MTAFAFLFATKTVTMLLKILNGQEKKTEITVLPGDLSTGVEN